MSVRISKLRWLWNVVDNVANRSEAKRTRALCMPQGPLEPVNWSANSLEKLQSKHSSNACALHGKILRSDMLKKISLRHRSDHGKCIRYTRY